MIFQSKLPKVGTTIFTVMSGLATKMGAINLGQGFPDFPMDAELVELVAKGLVSKEEARYKAQNKDSL